MLKRLAIVSAVIGAFGATAAFAEPTLELAVSSPPPSSFTSTAMALTQPSAQSEAFKPTAATKPAVLWDPDAHANSNP